MTADLAQVLLHAIVEASPETRASIRAALELDRDVVEPAGGRTAYTTSTLAAELGVTTRAVRGWIEGGELRGTMRAGRWIIAADEVARFATPRQPARGRARPRARAGTGVMAGARGKSGL